MGVCMSAIADGEVLSCMGASECRWKRKLTVAHDNSECHGSNLEVPKRLCSNGVTRSCCAYTKQGRKGVNQDCLLVWEDFGDQDETMFCGVFDGHGPMGHQVAREVRDSMATLVMQGGVEEYPHASVHTSAAHEDTTHVENEEPSSELWRRLFLQIYSKMDDELKVHPGLDCTCSGTTAVTLLVKQNNLVVANVGDSRAILVSRRDDASVCVDQLTVDFKPNLPGELERIRNCHGRVFALEDEPQVARVWLPHENRPGLAMARALGDFCLKDYGLSAVPHVSHRQLTKQEEFVVLATDGVWGVLSNEEVARIVEKVEPKGLAAKSVVDAAIKKWKRNFAHACIDDCAVICHFFNKKQASTSDLSSMSNSKQQFNDTPTIKTLDCQTIAPSESVVLSHDRGI